MSDDKREPVDLGRLRRNLQFMLNEDGKYALTEAVAAVNAIKELHAALDELEFYRNLPIGKLKHENAELRASCERKDKLLLEAVRYIGVDSSSRALQDRIRTETSPATSGKEDP